MQLGPVLPLLRREGERGEDLRQHEQHDQPAPDQQAQVDVVPQCDEGEDGGEVCHGADFAAAAAAERDVDVARHPAVEAAVPAAPEGQRGIVVADAAHHVLRRVDAVEEGPEAEEAPGEEEFEPYDVQVEVAQHAELEGRVGAPGGVGFADGDGVEVVQD